MNLRASHFTAAQPCHAHWSLSTSAIYHPMKERSGKWLCCCSPFGRLALLASGARYNVIERVPEDLGTLNDWRQRRPAGAHAALSAPTEFSM